MENREMPQPLEGVRIIDFTQVMFGPCGTLVLADYGADVIKIEKPGFGDLIRHSFKEDPEGIENAVYRSVNRNKRSMEVDVRSAEGRQVIYDLVKTADVVVDNFRAGVIERLGFGYEVLSQINPRIICASGTGFGGVGPLAYKGGQDILLQALSGVMARKPNADAPPAIFATALCDYTAGMHLAQAIMLALLQRGKTGCGQKVSVAMFDSMLAMQMQEVAVWFKDGRELNWGDRPLSGVFPTTDGAIVIVGAFKENPLQLICRALGLRDLSQEAKYADIKGQIAHKPELQHLFRTTIATDTTTHWLERFDEQDILCAPVLDLGAALDHPQTAANGKLVTTQNGERYFGSPLTLEDGAFRLRHEPPRLGQHTAEILDELEARVAGEPTSEASVRATRRA